MGKFIVLLAFVLTSGVFAQVSVEEARAKLAAKATTQPDFRNEIDQLRREVAALKQENNSLKNEIAKRDAVAKDIAAKAIQKKAAMTRDEVKEKLVGMTLEEAEEALGGKSYLMEANQRGKLYEIDPSTEAGSRSQTTYHLMVAFGKVKSFYMTSETIGPPIPTEVRRR